MISINQIINRFKLYYLMTIITIILWLIITITISIISITIKIIHKKLTSISMLTNYYTVTKITITQIIIQIIQYGRWRITWLFVHHFNLFNHSKSHIINFNHLLTINSHKVITINSHKVITINPHKVITINSHKINNHNNIIILTISIRITLIVIMI